MIVSGYKNAQMCCDNGCIQREPTNSRLSVDITTIRETLCIFIGRITSVAYYGI